MDGDRRGRGSGPRTPWGGSPPWWACRSVRDAASAADTVRAVLAVGAVGVNIEDAPYEDEGEPLRPVDEQAERITAAGQAPTRRVCRFSRTPVSTRSARRRGSRPHPGAGRRLPRRGCRRDPCPRGRRAGDRKAPRRRDRRSAERHGRVRRPAGCSCAAPDESASPWSGSPPASPWVSTGSLSPGPSSRGPSSSSSTRSAVR
ncbi:isocitrate lyase/phosphoenolpyruvate mutase family protein [Streptomyces canus]|uniref:isocitrate lyase/phosphoenolpyruvate mutase family protein n=1 Tax=Streptomyces canus TaxID=58343 RepID=UPI0036ED3D37